MPRSLWLVILGAAVGCYTPPPRPAAGRLTYMCAEPLRDEVAQVGPAYDRYAVTLPDSAGLKVWLEIAGEPVARLGWRHPWEQPRLPPHEDAEFPEAWAAQRVRGGWMNYGDLLPADTAWVLVRDVPLGTVAAPARFVELALIVGDPAQAMAADGDALGCPRAQSTGWVLPAPADDVDPSRRVLQLTYDEGQVTPVLTPVSELGLAWSTLELPLRPDEPQLLAEFPGPQPARLWIERVSAQP